MTSFCLEFFADCRKGLWMVDRVQHTGCHLGFSRYVCGGDRRGTDRRLPRSETALVVTTAGTALSSGLAAHLRPDLPHRRPFAVGIWILRASRERDLPIRNLRRKTQRPLLQLGTGRLAYWRVVHLGSERLGCCRCPVHEFPPHFVIPTLLLCEASSLGAFGTGGGGPEKMDGRPWLASTAQGPPSGAWTKRRKERQKIQAATNCRDQRRKSSR